MTPTSTSGTGLRMRQFCTSSPCDSFDLVMTAAVRLGRWARTAFVLVVAVAAAAVVVVLVVCARRTQQARSVAVNMQQEQSRSELGWMVLRIGEKMLLLERLMDS